MNEAEMVEDGREFGREEGAVSPGVREREGGVVQNVREEMQAGELLWKGRGEDEEG